MTKRIRTFKLQLFHCCNDFLQLKIFEFLIKACISRIYLPFKFDNNKSKCKLSKRGTSAPENKKNF